jgi:ThiS family.
MRIKIKFYARFQEYFGSEIIKEIDNNSTDTLKSIAKSVTEDNPEGQAFIFDDAGNFYDYVILMKNGERIYSDNADEIFVEDGDEIRIFPPVSGG